MPKINKVRDFSDVVDLYGKSFVETLHKRIYRFIRYLQKDLLPQARKRCPIKTGALRKSISFSIATVKKAEIYSMELKAGNQETAHYALKIHEFVSINNPQIVALIHEALAMNGLAVNLIKADTRLRNPYTLGARSIASGPLVGSKFLTRAIEDNKERYFERFKQEIAGFELEAWNVIFPKTVVINNKQRGKQRSDVLFHLGRLR